jgi:hypothetical protein
MPREPGVRKGDAADVSERPSGVLKGDESVLLRKTSRLGVAGGKIADDSVLRLCEGKSAFSESGSPSSVTFKVLLANDTVGSRWAL